MQENPLISIITVCYNAEMYLENAIISVVKQTYPNIEYIIIDGQSTDSTINIVNKYKSYITHFISEPDKGIYDAMNKGIKMASGELVYFLNSDDSLFDSKIINNVVEYYKRLGKPDVLYGKIILQNTKDIDSPERGYKTDIHALKKGNMIPHQATFMKKSVFLKVGMFNDNYRIGADYDLIVRSYINNYKFEYVNLIIANFRLGGISSSHKFNYLYVRERMVIIKNHFGYQTLLKYLPQGIKQIVKGFLKSTLISLKLLSNDF